MGVEITKRKRAIIGVNVRYVIVTIGDFVALLLSAVKGGDAALLKLLWDFLLEFDTFYYFVTVGLRSILMSTYVCLCLSAHMTRKPCC